MRVGISSICIFFTVFLVGCTKAVKNSQEVKLQFLDEYILPNDMLVDSTLVGGLSGIDFYKDTFYIACDDKEKPRFYTANIDISNYKFDTIKVLNAIELQESNNALDLESIVFDPVGKDIILTSEGNIKKGKDPLVFSTNHQGEFVRQFEIPQYFRAKGKQLPRNNGVFEGLTRSFDNEGYWVATELPLKLDGPKPKYTETTSPVRFTYFDKNGGATKQFAYLLDRISKQPLGDFGVNGITDILAYASNKLLVIERSFSSGHGNQGNVIKIYSVDHEHAVNTIKNKKLTNVNYYPVKKELVLNFETFRDSLTNKSIDNIEGICFGPELPNGNKSLIFIADNNFDRDLQLNQVILMEMILK